MLFLVFKYGFLMFFFTRFRMFRLGVFYLLCFFGLGRVEGLLGLGPPLSLKNLDFVAYSETKFLGMKTFVVCGALGTHN